MSIFKTNLFRILYKSSKPETYDENNIRLITKARKKIIHAQPCLRWACWYIVIAGASLSIVF